MQPTKRHNRAESSIGDGNAKEEQEIKGAMSDSMEDEITKPSEQIAISATEAAADKACWTTFVASAFLAFGIFCIAIYNSWQPPAPDGVKREILMHSFEYFILCMLGGVMSGLPHSILCPMDVVKCRVQVGEYTSMSAGFQTMYKEARKSTQGQGTIAWVWAFTVLCYRGIAPTFIGYSFQGSLKFGLYELFKFLIKSSFPEFTAAHKMMVFLAASAVAEFFADIALCPWEAVKIKMQTTKLYLPKLDIVMPRMWASEGFWGFYKGISPLWSRQIPYTMVKFTVFEKSVAFVYGYLVNSQTLTPRGHLAVSLGCGCFAGALCAIVSHPSDTLVSKINQRGSSAAQKGGPASPTAGSPAMLDGTQAQPNFPLNGGAQGQDQQQQPPLATDALGIAKELGCKGLWKGLWLRVAFIGMLTAMQWVIYDSFKVAVGLPTTGSNTKKK